MVSARSEAKRNRKNNNVPLSRLFFIRASGSRPSERASEPTESAKAREKENNASANTTTSLSLHIIEKITKEQNCKILPSSSTSFSCAASIKLSPTFALTVISSPVFSVNVTAIVFTSSSSESFPLSSLCLCSATREAVAMDEEGTTVVPFRVVRAR